MYRCPWLPSFPFPLSNSCRAQRPWPRWRGGGMDTDHWLVAGQHFDRIERCAGPADHGLPGGLWHGEPESGPGVAWGRQCSHADPLAGDRVPQHRDHAAGDILAARDPGRDHEHHHSRHIRQRQFGPLENKRSDPDPHGEGPRYPRWMPLAGFLASTTVLLFNGWLVLAG